MQEGINSFGNFTAGIVQRKHKTTQLQNENEELNNEVDKLQAKLTAERFDANPNYSAAAIRFVSCDESASAYGDIGATAAEGVRNTVCSLESAELTKIWERVNNDEKRSNKE